MNDNINNGNIFSNVPPEYTQTGYLIVRVSTARGAIPLENATVTVRGYDPSTTPDVSSGVLVSTRTNPDGSTDRIALPALPKALSQEAGNGKSFATYNIDVAAPGYYLQSNINVPIFEGITAVQNSYLIPLPENTTLGNEYYDRIRYFEGENPNL